MAAGGLRVNGRHADTRFPNWVAGQVVIKGQAWVGWEVRDPVLRCRTKSYEWSCPQAPGIERSPRQR